MRINEMENYLKQADKQSPKNIFIYTTGKNRTPVARENAEWHSEMGNLCNKINLSVRASEAGHKNILIHPTVNLLVFHYIILIHKIKLISSPIKSSSPNHIHNHISNCISQDMISKLCHKNFT